MITRISRQKTTNDKNNISKNSNGSIKNNNENTNSTTETTTLKVITTIILTVKSTGITLAKIATEIQRTTERIKKNIFALADCVRMCLDMNMLDEKGNLKRYGHTSTKCR